MWLLDLLAAQPEENLAIDDALLEVVDSHQMESTLRLWSFPQTVVVLGRGSQYHVEARVDQCERFSVPILRRSSGGAAIVAGPGCLLYSLVLRYDEYPQFKDRALDRLHQWVMQQLVAACQSLGIAASWQGTCDVTLGDCKVSGNSVRIGRQAVLYHGTFLCGMPLQWLSDFLGTPPRQPEYRQARGHDSFVCNLPVSANQLAAAIANTFCATGKVEAATAELLLKRAAQIAQQRSSSADWLLRH